VRRSGIGVRCGVALAALVSAALAAAPIAVCAPVQARHLEGTLHGFLSLTTDDGKVLAQGDLIEIVHGDRVFTRLTFHFKDGSLDDETTAYTQRGVFRLISDHHIQSGPYFPHPLDMEINVSKGTVVTRTPGKDGKEEVSTEEMKMPPDLYNGLVTPIVKNLHTETPETKISMIVATPKPRIVTLAISPQTPGAFSLAGFPHKALAWEIKIELGGLAGVIAPVIGKQSPNIYIWTEDGEVPAFLRETGPLFEGGVVLSINLIGPTWPEGDK
jgi:hypothetical protein